MLMLSIDTMSAGHNQTIETTTAVRVGVTGVIVVLQARFLANPGWLITQGMRVWHAAAPARLESAGIWRVGETS